MNGVVGGRRDGERGIGLASGVGSKAQLALSRVYGRTHIVTLGPQMKSQPLDDDGFLAGIEIASQLLLLRMSLIGPIGLLVEGDGGSVRKSVRGCALRCWPRPCTTRSLARQGTLIGGSPPRPPDEPGDPQLLQRCAIVSFSLFPRARAFRVPAGGRRPPAGTRNDPPLLFLAP